MDWWWMGGCGEEGEISKKKRSGTRMGGDREDYVLCTYGARFRHGGFPHQTDQGSNPSKRLARSHLLRLSLMSHDTPQPPVGTVTLTPGPRFGSSALYTWHMERRPSSDGLGTMGPLGSFKAAPIGILNRGIFDLILFTVRVNARDILW